ncbi:MAG: iron-containing alcohol dehydrogenase [Pseudomonadota bacterium]
MQAFDAGRVPPITFCPDRLSELGTLAVELGGGPVLVVADQILAQLGVVATAEASLIEAGLTVDMAADIAGEPKEALVDALADRARAMGARVVVGLGGGAAMDAAKLVAAIAGADAPAAHYALAANPFPTQGLPAIAVPTTAGTGSEVTRTAIVSTADGAKLWYWGEELMFAHALLDPALTVSLPAHITAWTGIDAVAHALEAATSRSANAAGRLFGLQGLEILSRALPRAVAHGTDLDARAEVMWGATVAGLALHNCNTHMGHNISHALGSLAPVHHGLATGLALEVALPGLVTRREGRANYAAAAAALGAGGYATALPDAFAGLQRAIGIGPNLPDTCQGVDADSLAAQMMAPANLGMAHNAACDLDAADLMGFAELMVDRIPEVRATG